MRLMMTKARRGFLSLLLPFVGCQKGKKAPKLLQGKEGCVLTQERKKIIFALSDDATL